MEVSQTKTARFSAVVKQCGAPKVYLPLAAPEHDPEFMRAVKQGRVLSLKQEPTSKRQDFGVAAFLREKFVTYLIFPKSLRAFENQRIVGIKYDVVGAGEFSTPAATRVPKPKAAPAKRSVTRPQPPAKKEPPKPKPFRVRVRMVTTVEKEVRVMAFKQKEARRAALQQLQQQAGDARITVVKIQQEKET